jgi:hypothetical protein
VLNFSLCTHFPKVELTQMEQTIEEVVSGSGSIQLYNRERISAICYMLYALCFMLYAVVLILLAVTVA